jgi:arylsulfatase A-like enzyme
VVEAGSVCNVPVISVDLYPTFLEVAGGRKTADQLLDGESLLPLMRGNGQLERTSLFWHFPGYLNNPVTRGRDPVFRTRPVSVINQDHWKLYLYHEEWQLDGGRGDLANNNAVELYNLKVDIGERTNLAQTNLARRDAMLDALLNWFDRTDAKMPTIANQESIKATPASKKSRRARAAPRKIAAEDPAKPDG